MNRRNYCDYYAASNRNLNDRDLYRNTYSNKTNTMNNNPTTSFTSTLNPAASPYKSTSLPQNNANYFNLTNIAKTKNEQYVKSVQRFNSNTDRRSNYDSKNFDTRSNHSSSEQLSHKKHKKDSKLESLIDKRSQLESDCDYYKRKHKRLSEEMHDCEEKIENCKNGIKILNDQISAEKKRLENESSKNNIVSSSTSGINNNQLNKTMNLTNNPANSSINVKLPPTQAAISIKPIATIPNNLNSNSLSPVLNSGVNSINNLSINSGKKELVVNAQASISNTISNLLNKKRDVEFLEFDYIFKKIEEITEPKLIDSKAERFEINLNLKKVLTNDDKKDGLRYIIRGCVYDDKSVKQEDNLSYVKSYDFKTPVKKHTYENAQSASSKLMFPFDFSDYCRFSTKLDITINLNTKLLKEKDCKIAFGVYYVKRLEYKDTLDIVQKRDIIRKKRSEITKSQVANSFGQSNNLIQMENIKIALVDPQSKAKISMPCIGENCEHIATFDGLTFLDVNSRKFSWYCPICGKPIGYNQLFYDELLNEILRKVSMDCTAIEFDKGSNWIPLSEEGKKNQEQESEECITLD